MLGVLAGCASTETKEQPAAAVEDRQPSVTTQPPVDTGPKVTPVKPPIIVGDPLDPRNPKSILAKRSVYYDYDSTVVKDENKPLVSYHALYLTNNSAYIMTVQCINDETGIRE